MAELTDLNKDPLYHSLAEQIEDEIANGKFRTGDKLYSIQDMCRNFAVSGATAFRAVEILKDRGIVKSFPKKGTFVTGVASQSRRLNPVYNLKRVVVIGNIAKFHRRGFTKMVFQGIFDEIQEHDLMFQIEETAGSSANGISSLSYTPVPGDGIIFITSRPDHSMNLLMLTPNLPIVSVDSANPHTPCVLTDNYDGMRRLILHLKEAGHRHIALAFGVSNGFNSTNENERREAFLHICAHEKIDSRVADCDRIEDLLPLLSAAGPPTALMFTRDDPALQFIDAAEKAGYRVPADISVTGFDGFSTMDRDISRLTTYRISQGELGRKAVRLLQDYDSKADYRREWYRIQGTFCRGSTVRNTGSEKI